jgi:hypothetical protein
MLNKTQMARLGPFLHHKRARQKIILYLLADGMDVKTLTQLGKDELAHLAVSEPLDIYVEQVLCESNGHNGAVFAYPCGTAFKTQDIYRIIRQATISVTGRAMKVSQFIEYITKG